MIIDKKLACKIQLLQLLGMLPFHHSSIVSFVMVVHQTASTQINYLMINKMNGCVCVVILYRRYINDYNG